MADRPGHGRTGPSSAAGALSQRLYDCVNRAEPPGRAGTSVSNIHDDFAGHGAANKPFWITEIGWSTCSDSTYCVSEATRAAYTSKLFTLLGSTYTYVDAVFLYRSSDLGPAGSSDPEQDFGLTHEDGSAKPVWNVLKAATGVA